MKVGLTVAAGQVVAENGKMLVQLPEFAYPEEATRSVHLKKASGSRRFRHPGANQARNSESKSDQSP